MADAWTMIAERLLPSARWRMDGPSVCLTFDDGPHPVATPAVLTILKSYRVPAVFFLVGRNAEQYPDLVRHIAEEGHVIGNHSYSHRPLWFAAPSVVEQELKMSHEAILRAAGKAPAFFRPPFSRIRPALISAAARAGYATVMYSVDSKDYRLNDAALIALRSARSLAPRDIVLFHDNIWTAPRVGATLDLFLTRALAKGLTFTGL